ncbi:unnamed protein product, partial [Brassica rapa subsp. trilocularis]
MDLGADEKINVWIFIPQSIPNDKLNSLTLRTYYNPYGIKPGRHYMSYLCNLCFWFIGHEKDRFKKTRE